MRGEDALSLPQREAVLHGKGPLLILAGAGSGKTRVIAHRIARLLREGVDPRAILAVTFTNKAAGEMRDRVKALLGVECGGLWVGTFHAFGAWVLRREARRVGLSPGFTIYDRDDAVKLLGECLQAAGWDPARIPSRPLLERISRAKGQCEGPADWLAAARTPWEEREAELFRLYEEALRRANAVDFDDLLALPAGMWGTDPEALAPYQERFRHILIDEYQDTNQAQYRLIRALSAAHGNLCVVGDDDQSIYGWRGADIRNILTFEEDHPGARVVLLDRNYRSTAPILEAATALVGHNLCRKPKRLWTSRTEGDPLTLYWAADEEDEARWIAQEAAGWGAARRDGPLGCAVLYRTNAQSRILEEALMLRGLPYRVVGGVGFYQRREIKDLLAYLRCLGNPADEVSFLRAVNVPPRGVGERGLALYRERCAERGVTLVSGLDRLAEMEGLPGPARRGLSDFQRILGSLRVLEGEAGLGPLLEGLLRETAYLDYLARTAGEEAEERVANVGELLSAGAEFHARALRGGQEAHLRDFLEVAALQEPLDGWTGRGPRVSLMTLHNAKGLEFSAVFIAGCEEGLLPLGRREDGGVDREEERRLLYVGMTRARDRLSLSCALQRAAFGQRGTRFPSPFLREIPRDLLREEVSHRLRGRVGEGAVWSREVGEDPVGRLEGERLEEDFSQDSPSYRRGERVRHPQFGAGTILAAAGRGQDLKVTVRFDEWGEKKIYVRYTRLERDG